ncbi:MAG: hypothetical protein GY946_26760 [bacterium]|nr:hypothetical protein [bacterium]
MRTIYIFSLVLLVCLSGLGLDAVHAEDAEEGGDAKFAVGELRLDTERVVIFKDGYSLFVRRARAIADEDGSVHTFEIPDAAVLGSFWAFSKTKKLLGMKAQFVTNNDKRHEKTSCITIVDLLRANKGNQVKLRLGDDQVLSGTIIDVLERPAPSRLPSARPSVSIPNQPGRFRMPTAPRPTAPSEVEFEVLPQGGQLVVVSTPGDGRVILPVSQVRSLTGRDLETTMVRRFESQRTRKQLQFELGAETAGKLVDINILYFTPGLRWIPTYRLSGELKDQGDLALQAEILNEVMDLDGVAADMVVGVPHFKFREVISPLSLEAQMRNVLRQAAPQLMGQHLSNAYFQSRSGEVRDNNSGSRIDIAPELAVAGSGDLFVYSIPKLTLAKGARATMPLWQSTVPLKHLYTADIALGRDARGGKSYVQQRSSRFDPRGRQRNEQSPLELAQHKVWHQFQMTNEGDVPWTTGAALTMRGNLPLGQDMLTYTPVGAEALLPLTVAVDVCAEYDEEEIKRDPNAETWQGHRYARITKRATIHLCNYRGKSTRMRLKLGLGGKVLEASDGGVLKINDFRAEDWTNNGYAGRGINNHTDVEWNIELKAGETKDLVITYEFFIRS